MGKMGEEGNGKTDGHGGLASGSRAVDNADRFFVGIMKIDEKEI